MASSTPTQVRAVDPFASYNSDTVNKLTRIINLGEDCLESAKACDVTLDSTSTSQVVMQPGVAYKDDVWLDFTAQHTVNFNDPDHYYDFNIMNITTGYYYVVLSYTYQRQRPAPEAEILILTPNQRSMYSHGGDWLLLKVVDVSAVGPIVIDSVLSYDPDTVANRRIIATEYAGTEIALPTFDSTRDPSRLVYVENENTYYFGLANGWSLPIGGGGTGGAGSVIEVNTTGFSVGDLVYTTSAGNLAAAIASAQISTADGAVTRVGTSGLVQMSGKVFGVPVETGITPSVGALLYLSKTDPGAVTTVKSTPNHQFVGRCVDVVDSTSVNMFFVRGEPGSTGAAEYCTYVEATLPSSGWVGSGPYYQDVNIADISETNAIISVWNAATDLKVEPDDIEYVSSSIARIWMPSNTLTLNVLVLGQSAALVSSSNITEIYDILPFTSWQGAGPYYQDIDISTIDSSNNTVIVMARDLATDEVINPTTLEFDTTSNLRVWMSNNNYSLGVSVQGPSASTSTMTALTTVLAAGGSWVLSGGTYYQDINISTFGDNYVTIQCVDNSTDKVIEPLEIEFVSSSVVRIKMSTNATQLNVTIIG